ncbi:hypothetical protein DE146DRAFT_233355 [Phaeosphaeria sp. MPI-PUGE-AT-0046c]|nr:hypothetical protein DE146DRAFT_233355 [Phaeosphaeria sp. MPI-PUGE-AT-0046c]
MSNLEYCSPALLGSPAFSHVPGDPDDPSTDTCSICYQPLNSDIAGADAEHPVQLACGHIFGLSCIDTWATFSATCPMCRAGLDFQDAYTATFWQNQVEGETSSASVSQVGADECFGVRIEYTTPTMATSQFEDDMWLALACHEADALCSSRKRRFSAYEEDAIENSRTRKRPRHADPISPDNRLAYFEEVSFNEFVTSHEEWMTSTSSTEGVDEFTVSYYDVFLC